ncbi:MAG TPA: hypothetical protein PKM25_13280, partial [Candidatus Ozemobacteraceae bacterium]|nr:hypothetical protein [Candidatus Ozemobacteraceae bacterium]
MACRLHRAGGMSRLKIRFSTGTALLFLMFLLCTGPAAETAGPTPLPSATNPYPAGWSASDLMSGVITQIDRGAGRFEVRSADGATFTIILTRETNAQVIKNLGEPSEDPTVQVQPFLLPGRYVSVYGTFYPERGSFVFEAQKLFFFGETPG